MSHNTTLSSTALIFPNAILNQFLDWIRARPEIFPPAPRQFPGQIGPARHDPDHDGLIIDFDPIEASSGPDIGLPCEVGRDGDLILAGNGGDHSPKDVQGKSSCQGARS
jgi:hypothetical protein